MKREKEKTNPPSWIHVLPTLKTGQTRFHVLLAFSLLLLWSWLPLVGYYAFPLSMVVNIRMQFNVASCDALDRVRTWFKRVALLRRDAHSQHIHWYHFQIVIILWSNASRCTVKRRTFQMASTPTFKLNQISSHIKTSTAIQLPDSS